MFAVISCPALGFAQVPELLGPVLQGDEKRLSATNDYFLKKNGYFAKRSRIVRVNTDLLVGNTEKFTIELFDGVKISVARTELELRNEGDRINWIGTYDPDQYFTKAAYEKLNPHMSQERVNLVYNTLMGVNIRATKYSYDDDVSTANELVELHHNPMTGKIVSERERLSARIEEDKTFYSVRFTLRPLAGPNSANSDGSPFMGDYRIEPLPFDRRFNVLLEIDPSKNFPRSDSYSQLSSIQLEKMEKYQRFVESLGPKPTKSPPYEGDMK